MMSSLAALYSDSDKITRIVILCFLFLVAATFCSAIFDPDFFWHIASGRWMVDNLSLPDKDPFGADNFITDNRTTFLLKGYWLSQVFYYLVYRVASYNGIVIIKSFVFVAIFFLLLSRRKEVPLSSSLLAVVPLYEVLLHFRADRPNTFSFLFFVLLLISLEKRNARWLPALMIIWANVHGGYVLGFPLLLIYAADWYWRSRTSGIRDPAMYWALAAIPASFLNPAGIVAPLLLVRMEGGGYQQHILEFLSPIQLAVKFSDIYWGYFIALLAGLLLLFLCFRAGKLRINQLLVFFLLAAISLQHSRYMPFLVLGVAVYAPVWMSEVLVERWFRGAKALSVAMIVLVSLFYVDVTTGRAMTTGIESRRFPSGTIQHLAALGSGERIFCNDAWGGFLIWSLPGRTVMVDGRALSEDDYVEALKIQSSGEGWQEFFQRKRIDVAVISAFNPTTGAMQQLWRALLASREWNLIYADNVSLVFRKMKSGEAPAELAPAYRQGFDHALAQAQYFAEKYPETPWHWENLATIRALRGERQESLTALRQALRLAPGNESYRSRVALLEKSLQ